MSWIITGTQRYEPITQGYWDIGITIADTSFALTTNSTCNFNVDWGDGQIDNNVSVGGTATTSHAYASSGSYVVRVTLNSGNFYPYYNNNAQATKITSLGATPTGWSFGASLIGSFFGAANVTTISPQMNTGAVTNFANTWRDCSSLTSFPLLNTSSGTNFSFAWAACSSLTSFPAGFFDSWTATPANNCFVNAWDSCSSLSATSVENILNSIDTSGKSAPASGVDITIDYNAASGTPNISTAVTSLKSRGWTITLNGVAQ